VAHARYSIATTGDSRKGDAPSPGGTVGGAINNDGGRLALNSAQIVPSQTGPDEPSGAIYLSGQRRAQLTTSAT